MISRVARVLIAAAYTILNALSAQAQSLSVIGLEDVYGLQHAIRTGETTALTVDTGLVGRIDLEDIMSLGRIYGREARPAVYLPEVTGAFEGTTLRLAAMFSDSRITVSEYRWDFGDGTVALDTDGLVSHVYASAGTYQISLRIRSTDGVIGEWRGRATVEQFSSSGLASGAGRSVYQNADTFPVVMDTAVMGRPVNMVAGVVMVVFNDNATSGWIDGAIAVASARGATVGGQFPAMRCIELRLAASDSIAGMIQALTGLPGVQEATYDGIGGTDIAFGSIGENPALSTALNGYRWLGDRIDGGVDLRFAWKIATGAAFPRLGVLEYDAPAAEIMRTLLGKTDVVVLDANNASVHSIPVMGTMTARGDDGVTADGRKSTGIAWINPAILKRSATKWSLTGENLRTLIVDNAEVRIVNISLGIANNQTSLDHQSMRSWLYPAVQAAAQNDVLIFKSSGNFGATDDDTYTPWAFKNHGSWESYTVIVTGVTSSGARHASATTGRITDIAAPWWIRMEQNSSWAEMGGTSFSTPMAAGVAALVWGRSPELSAPQVKRILLASAYHPDNDDFRTGKLGAGIVNAYRALNQPLITSITPSQVPAGDSITIRGFQLVSPLNEMLCTVAINGVSARIRSSDSRQIVCDMPNLTVGSSCTVSVCVSVPLPPNGLPGRETLCDTRTAILTVIESLRTTHPAFGKWFVGNFAGNDDSGTWNIVVDSTGRVEMSLRSIRGFTYSGTGVLRASNGTFSGLRYAGGVIQGSINGEATETSISGLYLSDDGQSTGVMSGTIVRDSVQKAIAYQIVPLQPDGSTDVFHDVHFFDVMNGIGLYWKRNIPGIYIARTVDGGATWAPISSWDTRSTAYLIEFSDANRGWVCGTSLNGNDSIVGAATFRTDNGGISWNNASSEFQNRAVMNIQFLNDTFGFAHSVDTSTMRFNYMTTINGGLSWTSRNSPSDSKYMSVYFLTENFAVLEASDTHYAYNSSRYYSFNGGVTWDQISTMDISGAEITPYSNSSWLALDSSGRVWSSTNSGQTWSFETSFTMFGADTLWSYREVGRVRVFFSYLRNATDFNDYKARLKSFFKYRQNAPWDTVYPQNNVLQRTFDGGNTWMTIATGIRLDWTIDALDENNFWAHRLIYTGPNPYNYRQLLTRVAPVDVFVPTPPITPPVSISLSDASASVMNNGSITFRIKYFEPNNRYPDIYNVTVNGTPYAMTLASGSAPTSGLIYQATVALGDGTHTYSFNFTAGSSLINYPSSGTLGVTRAANLPPMLSSFFSELNNAGQALFRIRYSDPEGASPSSARAYIDGVMQTLDLASGNPTMGAIYRAMMGNPPLGQHNIYFEFIDGINTVRYPAAGQVNFRISPASAEMIVEEGFTDRTDAALQSSGWQMGDDNADNGQVYWGVLNAGGDARSGAVAPVLWCAKNKNYGDATQFLRYEDRQGAYFQRTFDFSGCATVIFSFDHFYQTESGWDKFSVVLKRTGMVDQMVYGPVSGSSTSLSPNTGGWIRRLIDLTPYTAGRSGVTLKFSFESDNNTRNYSGVYLDNIWLVTARKTLTIE